MKKIIFIVIACITMPFILHAQQSLHGLILDASDNTPLPGSHVIVKDSHIGAFAGSNGQFQLFGLTPGPAVIEISFLGYNSKTLHVDVPMNEPLRITLERRATLTSEVVVVANRAGNRTGATFTDVSREQLMPSNLGQDLPVLISQTPSVVVSTDAGTGIGYTSMNIRGSDNSRINVTLNGIPVNDAESHGVWWVNMPDLVSSVDNLQIQRGVGLSTHGAGAFGATISIQSSALRDKTYAELSSSAGSFNTSKNTLSFGTGLIENHWAFDGRISSISSDGYIDRASARLRSYYLSGGYYGSKTMVKAVMFSGQETTYQAWNGVPRDSLKTNRRFNPSGMFFDELGRMQFYDNETDNYQQDHYQLHLAHAPTAHLTANLSLHYTYGRGYYEQYRQNERLNRYGLPSVVIGEQTISRTDLVRRRWLDNHFYGFTYALNYNTFFNTTATLGGGYNHYDGDHYGEIIWARTAPHTNKGHRYYDNNGFKKDFNNFLKIHHLLLPNLNIFADLQYRYVSYDFLGLAWVLGEVTPLEQQVRFHFFNPKAGLTYYVAPRQQIYVYGGIGNREPVRRDFTESTPESRPKHETLRNIELGYKYSGNKLLFASNLYLMNYKDQLILTGEINDSGGFTRTNIAKSHRMGVETELAYIINSRLQWSANLTLSRNKIPEFTEYSDVYDSQWNWIGMQSQTYKNTDIAFSPNIVASSMLQADPWPTVSVSLITKYVGRQYIDNTMHADRMLNPYLVNNVRVNYRPANRLFRKLEFVAMVNNLTNAMYETNAWIYKAYTGNNELTTLDDGYFPQAGRHFLLGINMAL